MAIGAMFVGICRPYKDDVIYNVSKLTITFISNVLQNTYVSRKNTVFTHVLWFTTRNNDR